MPMHAEGVPSTLNRAQCTVPILAPQVSSNGDVSFCPCDDFRKVEELQLGNLWDSTLADMYDSPKVGAL